MPTKKRERMISEQRNHVLEIYVSSITSGSRIEVGSAGGQIVWKGTAPSHLKNRPKFVRTPIGAGSGVV
jgi:hypothetical protein